MKRLPAALCAAFLLSLLSGCSEEDEAIRRCGQLSTEAQQAACRQEVYRRVEMEREKNL